MRRTPVQVSVRAGASVFWEKTGFLLEVVWIDDPQTDGRLEDNTTIGHVPDHGPIPQLGDTLGRRVFQTFRP